MFVEHGEQIVCVRVCVCVIVIVLQIANSAYSSA